VQVASLCPGAFYWLRPVYKGRQICCRGMRVIFSGVCFLSIILLMNRAFIQTEELFLSESYFASDRKKYAGRDITVLSAKCCIEIDRGQPVDGPPFSRTKEHR